jgi:hypothetical protein
MLIIPRLAKAMVDVPSLDEVLLFTNALGRQANVQTHKNSKLYKTQRRVPLFMVSQEKSKISSWCINNTKNCLKHVRNEKVMGPPNVHGQKIEKMLNLALGNCLKNTQIQSLYVILLPLEFKDEL